MNPLPTLLTALWTDDPTTQGWLLSMLGLAVFAEVYLMLPLRRRLRRTRKLKTTLVEDARRQENEGDRRTRLSKTLEGSVLRRPWGEFLRQWRDARVSSLHDRAPVRFADALALFPLCPVGPKTALIAALPGVFLGLGILGTFFGLVLGLPGIGEHFRNADATPPAVQVEGAASVDPETELLKGQIDHQIHQMTDALGLAFKTSLWGLILSMWFSLWIRRLEGGFDLEASELDDVVREVFAWVGPGELEALSLRKQADAFDLLRTEFTTLASELGNIFSGGLHAIERSMAQAASLVSTEQREALGRIVGEISDTIQSGVKHQLEELAAAVETTRENQERVAGILADTLQQIADASGQHRNLLEQLNATAEGLDRVAARTIEGAERAAPVVDQLRQAGGALEQAAEAARRTQEATRTSLETLEGALAQSRGVVEEQRRLAETSLGEMRVALNTVSAGLGDSLVNALRQVDDVLGQAVARLSGTIHNSSETLDRLSQPIAELRDNLARISESVGEMGGMVARLGPELSAGLQPVGANLELVGAQVGGLVAVMGDGLESKMRELRDSMVDSANRVNGILDRLGGEVEGRIGPLMSVMSEASERLSSLVTAIEKVGSETAAPRPKDPMSASSGTLGTQVVPRMDVVSGLASLPTDTVPTVSPVPPGPASALATTPTSTLGASVRQDEVADLGRTTGVDPTPSRTQSRWWTRFGGSGRA